MQNIIKYLLLLIIPLPLLGNQQIIGDKVTGPVEKEFLVVEDYLGISDLKLESYYRKSVEAITIDREGLFKNLKNSTIPSNNKGWKINLTRFTRDSTFNATGSVFILPKFITVIIDSLTETLLEIKAYNDDNTATTDTANIAMIPMEPFGEQYLELPADKPAVGFIECLTVQNCLFDQAQRIHAVYVKYTNHLLNVNRTDSVSIPAWIIYIDGIIPFSISSNAVYDNQKIVINATTGEIILGPYSISK